MPRMVNTSTEKDESDQPIESLPCLLKSALEEILKRQHQEQYSHQSVRVVHLKWNADDWELECDSLIADRLGTEKLRANAIIRMGRNLDDQAIRERAPRVSSSNSLSP
jgi:hypothetical protein